MSLSQHFKSFTKIASLSIAFCSEYVSGLLVNISKSFTKIEHCLLQKAAKALLVLIPLLGVTYIVVIATPSDPVAEVVFIYIQATFLSIQVQNSLKHHFKRWKTQKSIDRSRSNSIWQSRSSHRQSSRKNSRHVTVASMVRFTKDSVKTKSFKGPPDLQNMV
ncbi:diuretic hormone receptor [Caerostris extrusa]|uniref:Diuretic hormone receptor n=1 Tax=Caerostris extrusa TaxID=172846 RepID=A0AAV4VPY5_CAEEX|nr:diuretic hormone receptor [Caerostris extrusa]